jgi:hypothetical protein
MPMKHVSLVATLDWEIDTFKVAYLLHMTRAAVLGLVKDGRSANYLVSAWLDSNGFNRISDGASGSLFTQDDLVYRLRVGAEKLSLAPSGAKGMGRHHTEERQENENAKFDCFLVCFTIDMPLAPIYSVSVKWAEDAQKKKLLDDKWSVPTLQIRQIIMHAARA